ncbi:MAG TPA: hypothetical protein VMG12_43135 [Polyangiaceae bacterium]|nr:hypothetical protein [Polyangiaceae bacterium]
MRRIPLAKRRAALAVVAAIAIGVCLASSWRWLRRIAREREAARSSAAAVIDGRARAPEPSNDPPRLDAVAEEHDAAPLDRPDVGAPLGGPRAKGAKPTSRPKPRAPTPPQHEPCVCLPGDPLCGCLD